MQKAREYDIIIRVAFKINERKIKIHTSGENCIGAVWQSSGGFWQCAAVVEKTEGGH